MADDSGYLNRRVRSNYLTSMFSIALVLFLLGIFCLAALTGNEVVRVAKEELEMQVLLTSEVTEDQRFALQESLRSLPSVKTVRYESPEDAGKEFIESTGEQFKEALENFNPFRPVIMLTLKSEFLNKGYIDSLKTNLDENPIVVEVDYPIELLSKVETNVSVLRKLVAGIGILLLFVAYLLILNTIRLVVYSKRLLIRTMQLIGAKSNFIRAPFLRKGLLQGGLSGLLASVGLFSLMYAFTLEFPGYSRLLENEAFIGLYLGLILTGAFLGLVSSFHAVNRYLNKPLDQIV